MNIFASLNRTILANGESLRSWAAFVQLILLPLTFIALLGAIVQFNKNVSKSDLTIEFMYPESLAFKVVNSSGVLAEKPLYFAAILDMDEQNFPPAPIPARELSYIKAHQSSGPYALMSEYGKNEHNYLGFLQIAAANSKKVRRYYVSFRHGVKGSGWYMEVSPDEDKPLPKQPTDEQYMDIKFPREKRIAFK